ncbi:MAG: cob(I)yrinic acid a,c-diamide adenosyltransferase [Phycisphaerae bacterium]
MKIYTKTGDKGFTGLIGGDRLSKAHLRIETYGTVDEINAVLGVAVVTAAGEMAQRLKVVQDELFVIGSRLAVVDAQYAASLPEVTDEMIQRLETEIDTATRALPELRQFILPGGTELAARLHLARTVARRAERMCVALGQHEPVAEVVLAYLNRLSDWLFVQARLANHEAGVADVPWQRS